MSTSPDRFSPKDPLESMTLSVDFAALLGTATISAAQVSATRHAGAADASPSAILVGQAQVSGTRVAQRVAGGVDGCTYLLRYSVTSSTGDTWVEALSLAVETAR